MHFLFHCDNCFSLITAIHVLYFDTAQKTLLKLLEHMQFCWFMDEDCIHLISHNCSILFEIAEKIDINLNE